MRIHTGGNGNMARSSLVALSCSALLMILLQGCGNNEDEQAPVLEEPVVEREVVEVIVEKPVPEKKPDCSNASALTASSRAWCQGLDVWKRSTVFAKDDNQKRDAFINAYGFGQQDAAMAANPQSYSGQPVVQAGYRAGYQAVVEAQGLVSYSCDGESDNEYLDRWCEASAAYKSSGLGASNNAILRGRYVDGYMSGRAIALTIPTAMDVMFSGETKAGSRQAITEPSAMKSKAERAFYQGFDEGHRTMVALIQESINQVMQQMPQGMETMPSMPGMESMMPIEPSKPTQ